jgi:WD40 repeat protein
MKEIFRLRLHDSDITLVSSCLKTLLVVVIFFSPAIAVNAVEVTDWKYVTNSQIDGIAIAEEASIISIGGERIHVLSNTGELIRKQWFGENIQVSSDGNLTAFSNGCTLTLLDRDFKQLWEKEIGTIIDLVMVPDGSLIVAGDLASNVYFFDNQGDMIKENNVRLNSERVHTSITNIACSGDGKYIYVLTTTGVFCFDTRGSMIWWKKGEYGEGGRYMDVAYSGGDVVIANEQRLRCYQGRSIPEWEYYSPKKIISVAISSNGGIIAVGSQDNALRIFDREGNQLWDYDADLWFNDIDLSKNGSVLIAGTLDKHIYLFKKDGTILSTIATGAPIKDVIISPDDTYAAAITKDTLYGFLIDPTEYNITINQTADSVENTTPLQVTTTPKNVDVFFSSPIILFLQSKILVIAAFGILVTLLLLWAWEKI